MVWSGSRSRARPRVSPRTHIRLGACVGSTRRGAVGGPGRGDRTAGVPCAWAWTADASSPRLWLATDVGQIFQVDVSPAPTLDVTYLGNGPPAAAMVPIGATVLVVYGQFADGAVLAVRGSNPPGACAARPSTAH